jgi:hypothetical protein
VIAPRNIGIICGGLPFFAISVSSASFNGGSLAPKSTTLPASAVTPAPEPTAW